MNMWIEYPSQIHECSASPRVTAARSLTPQYLDGRYEHRLSFHVTTASGKTWQDLWPSRKHQRFPQFLPGCWPEDRVLGPEAYHPLSIFLLVQYLGRRRGGEESPWSTYLAANKCFPRRTGIAIVQSPFRQLSRAPQSPSRCK